MESRSCSTPGEPMSRHLYGEWITDPEQKGIRLIGYDRPGYGGSTAHPGHTVASAAQDVRAIADALRHDRLGIWGISGGGPYALACAALLPNLAVAVAAVASIAPYGVEDFDYFAGMGESNVESFELYFSDPEASRRDLAESREQILQATPEQFVKELESLLSPVDAEALSGDLAQWLLESNKVALTPGDQGWWDDGAAHLSSWGLISATSGCPSRSGMAARTGSFPCSTASGSPPASPARRLISATAPAI